MFLQNKPSFLNRGKESAVTKIIRVVFPKWNKKKGPKQMEEKAVEKKRSKEGALKSLGKNTETQRMIKEIESNLESLEEFYQNSCLKSKEMSVPIDPKKLKQNSILFTYKDKLGQFTIGADQIINTFHCLQQLKESPGMFFGYDIMKLKVTFLILRI